MSLQFYIGRAGTGKTFRIVQEIREALKSDSLGDPIIYIVPDQMSFQAESQLISGDDVVGMMRAQVYSFSRLAWLIIGQTGGSTISRLNQVGVHMLLRRVLEEEKPHLQLFAGTTDKTGFIDNLAQLFTEYKRYLVDPEQLQQVADEEAAIAFKAKLADMAHVYQSYLAEMSGHYLDGEDNLRQLATAIASSDYLRSATIYIDGFHGFTPLELAVIEQLCIHCKKVHVALTLDRPYSLEPPSDYQLFRMTGDSYYQIYQLALAHEITIEQDVVFGECVRFQQSPGIAHLERFLNHRPIQLKHEIPELTLITANNPRLEVEAIARQIVHLAQEGNRYQDIVVLFRNSEQYTALVETIFTDYEIPIFMDQKYSMMHHPLIQLVSAVLAVYQSNFSYDAVFRAVKTDFFFAASDGAVGGQREAVARLENYVLSRGIQGSTKWGELWFFKIHRALELEKTVQTDEELTIQQELNRLRAQIYQPLQQFCEAVKVAANTREFATALFQLLEQLQVSQQLIAAAERLEAEGQLVRAKENQQAWRAIVDLLDQAVEIAGDGAMPFATFQAMIESGMEALKFSLVPPSLDQVVVGSLDVAKPQNVQYLFMVGLNEGVFPQKISDTGILKEDERTKLLDAGIRLAPSALTQLYDEEFIAYTSFTMASKHVYFSYPIADEEGKTLLISSYLKRLQTMFPTMNHIYAQLDLQGLTDEEQLSYITPANTTLKYLVKQLQLVKVDQSISPVWWDVYNEYMAGTEKKDIAVFVLGSLFYQNQSQALSAATINQLYGDRLTGTVSRIEQFNRCPFAYFVRFGLTLRERPLHQMTRPDIGTFFHESLSMIAEELTAKNLSWSDLSQEKCDKLASEMADKIAPRMQYQVLYANERMKFLKNKYTEIVKKATLAMNRQAVLSDFRPLGFEIGFGTPDSSIPPLVVPLQHGKSMALSGRVDRVDAAKNIEDGKDYLLLVDYKSSAKAINYAEVYHGISLQLFTYLDVLTKHSDKLLKPGMLPAGALYFYLHNPMLKEDVLQSDSDLEQNWFKQFKMNGLLSDDFGALQLMDHTLPLAGRSDVVPVEIKKDGAYSQRAKVASHDQLQMLTNHVQKVYQNSGNKILSGNTDISPYQLGKEKSCTYCEFKAMCQFDRGLPDNQFRQLRPMNMQQSLDKMSR